MVKIIAEIGSVHDGSFGNAGKLIESVAKTGADAVKFQTHIAEAETLASAPSPHYFKDESRMAYFRRTSFTIEQWRSLKQRAEDNGLLFLSSPFSNAAVDLLEEIGMAEYKIPSGEITNIPLLERVAKTGKPILLSSGMSSWEELELAVKTVRRFHDRLLVMQCTSEYPCAYENVGLNILGEMRSRFGLPVGLSDHTLSPYAAFAAVTLGACVVEKHFTYSRLMYGSDAKHSMEPGEFKDMVEGIRAIEKMMAAPLDKDQIGRYQAMKDTFQKSIVSAVDIPEGAVLTEAMVEFKKPGTGIPPRDLPKVLGMKARRAIGRDTLLAFGDLH